MPRPHRRSARLGRHRYRAYWQVRHQRGNQRVALRAVRGYVRQGYRSVIAGRVRARSLWSRLRERVVTGRYHNL